MLWRDTALDPRLGPIDARAAWSLLILLFHLSLATFLFAFVTCIAFGIVERYGYTPNVAVRVVRTKLAGRIRPVMDANRMVSSEYWRRRTWGLR